MLTETSQHENVGAIETLINGKSSSYPADVAHLSMAKHVYGNTLSQVLAPDLANHDEGKFRMLRSFLPPLD
jgi:hypothetical protein